MPISSNKHVLRADDVIVRVTCAPLQVNNTTEMLNWCRWLITDAPFKKKHQALHMKHNPPSGARAARKVTAIV